MQGDSCFELCDSALADAEAGCPPTRRRGAEKRSTLLTDRRRIACHIKPLPGHLAVARLSGFSDCIC